MPRMQAPGAESLSARSSTRPPTAIAQRIGRERLAAWVQRVGYGNGRIGPTPAMVWHDGVLTVTPRQQLAFVDRLRTGYLDLELVRRELATLPADAPADRREALTATIATCEQLTAGLVFPFLGTAETEQGPWLLGFLTIRDDRAEGAFDLDDVDVFRALASQAARVIESSQAYERVKERDRLAALGEMSAGLAHEIRNPLNAALLQLELLGRIGSRVADPSQRERIGDCARLVQSEIRRLTRLLEEFLSLARPRTLERYPVDVRALLDYVATMQRPLAEIAHIELQVVVPDGLPRVLGDQPKLTQVLINLVVNAIDAMREAGMRGTIELRGEAVGDRVCIRVADTGPGIDERVAKDLFRPFVSTKEMGTGLGLSIAKRIIDQHGGTVELGPRPGGGTVASVLLQTVPAAAHE